jgi:predicted nucleotide-binding protein
MVRRKDEGTLPPPDLTVPKGEAFSRIQKLIEEGKVIFQKEINSKEEFEQVDSLKSKWNNFCYELLSRHFDNIKYAEEFKYAGSSSFGIVVSRGGAPSWYERVDGLRKLMRSKIQSLESINERLEIISGPIIEVHEQGITHETIIKVRDIFVVHGHDDAAKQAVARFLEKLNLNAIILHEQPDGGRTVIEKIVDYSDVGFAVILLTPDDIGYPKDNPEKGKARARQNVIFELGYFIGKFGRKNVCALYKEGVELPSDFQGVLYVPMDPAEGWHMKLAREIKHAGIELDLNKII